MFSTKYDKLLSKRLRSLERATIAAADTLRGVDMPAYELLIAAAATIAKAYLVTTARSALKAAEGKQLGHLASL